MHHSVVSILLIQNNRTKFSPLRLLILVTYLQLIKYYKRQPYIVVFIISLFSTYPNIYILNDFSTHGNIKFSLFQRHKNTSKMYF